MLAERWRCSGTRCKPRILNPRIAISWMMLLSAALLSQLSAVLGTRYRRKLAEQLAALAENHRLLGREMDLRAETASALERDHVRLQASESMLRKVFEASPDNIAINRLSDGRFIAVNDNYRVAGYTRADVLGANVIALGTWQHKEEIAQFLESLRRTGRVRNMEIIQRRKDGAVDETHLISASLIEVNGEPCVISMLRDITEIKRVETSLRASHAALRKIFDATLDIIVVTRLSDGSYIDFNRQFERIGCRQQDPDDSRKGQRKIWASAEQHQELRDRIMADGVVRNMEVDFLLPDGGLMPALLSAVRVELDGEDCLVKMIRDLTAAKEASRKVEENAKAVRDIFAVSPDAISVNRVSDGKFVAFNEGFLSLTGYTREQAMSSSALELKVWTDPADRMRLAAALAQNGTVRNLEIEFQISQWHSRSHPDLGIDDRTRERAMHSRVHSRHHRAQAQRARPAIGARGIVAAGKGAQRQRGDLPQTFRRQPGQHGADRSRWKLYRCQPGIHPGDRVFARRDHRPSFHRVQHVDPSGRNDCLRRSTFEDQRSPQP